MNRPTCSARGCRRSIDRGRLMCDDHWSRVPYDLQRRIADGRREFFRNRTLDAYNQAVRDAIECVGRAEVPT